MVSLQTQQHNISSMVTLKVKKVYKGTDHMLLFKQISEPQVSTRTAFHFLAHQKPGISEELKLGVTYAK